MAREDKNKFGWGDKFMLSASKAFWQVVFYLSKTSVCHLHANKSIQSNREEVIKMSQNIKLCRSKLETHPNIINPSGSIKNKLTSVITIHC